LSHDALEFVLEAPVAGVPELVLSTADDELTLEWAFGHRHVTYYGESVTAGAAVERAMAIVRDIQSESLVAVEGRSGRFFGKFGGIVPVAEFEKRRSEGKIRKAISWRATYSVSG
jgi:hypothetical protein